MEYTYKTSIANKIGDIFLMALMLGGGCGLLFGGKFGANLGNNPNTPFLSIPLFGIGAVMLVFLVKELTQQILISSDRIEQSDIFGKRRLAVGDIAGWRVVQSGGGRSRVVYSIKIDPKEKKRGKPIKISSAVKIDAVFKKWIMKFPDRTLPGGVFGPRINAMKSGPKFVEQMNDPKFIVRIATLENSNFYTSPERMVDNYFAQWKL